MSAMVTDYDWWRNTLLVSSPVIPSTIRLTKQDEREPRMTRVIDYVPKGILDDARQTIDEYGNYILWLSNFVPSDIWDEVHRQITAMGINYRGADDV